MSTIAASGDTPNYVLMDANRRIGPKVIPLHSQIECTLIYGFSDKRLYDKFCSNTEQSLTPYPLVKTYLREQVGGLSNGLGLVVIDAAGPDVPVLHAATMQAVLEAHENRTTHVATTHQLLFDQKADAYRLEEASA